MFDQENSSFLWTKFLEALEKLSNFKLFANLSWQSIFNSTDSSSQHNINWVANSFVNDLERGKERKRKKEKGKKERKKKERYKEKKKLRKERKKERYKKKKLWKERKKKILRNYKRKKERTKRKKEITKKQWESKIKNF